MNLSRFLAILCLVVPSFAATSISGVWANDGGDKVTQDELRLYSHKENLTGSTRNRVWNGSKIAVFGGRNETVSFNLTIEAAKTLASNVSVVFNILSGPNNWKIRTSGTDPTNWVNRPIELFYERYVQIQGLSFFGYAFDNSQIPKRFQAASNNWADRPDHDKWYPDALVPVELVKTFNIQAGQNQSIWCDIFIPKRAPAGLYKGSLKIYEGSGLSRQIPVELTVQPFTLPDSPTAKTMLFLDNSDIEYRYVTGHGGYAQWDQPGGRKIQSVMDKYYQFIHRHKMSAIGENECPPADQPCVSSIARLDGSLYTSQFGYDGPGIGTPNGVYSIGTYGTWGVAGYQIPYWKNDPTLIAQHMNGFGSWFQQNLPGTDAFLYLQDEPGAADFPQVEKWARWMASNTGPGHFVKSFSTVSSVYAMSAIPDLAISATTAGVGNCPLGAGSCNNTTATQQAYSSFQQPGKQFWVYNDGRPGVGTFDTESDGVDPRTIPIAQYKMGVSRWYYWLTNSNGDMDTFASATSWGSRDHMDVQRGMWSDYAPTNGNGLLVYPGMDVGHTANSYGMLGPIASIRLKNWRRGIQDADYFAMAAKVNPQATQAILQALYPKALWENTVTDPSWPITPVTFPSDPDAYETARYQLAQIITGATVTPVPTPVPVPVPVPPAPVPSPANPPDLALNSWVQLVSRNSGKCVESVQGQTIGGLFQQQTCRNAGQQKVRLTAVSNGFEVNSLHSGLQFGIDGGPSATQNGQKLLQYKYSGDSNQIFWLESTADGYFFIHPSSSGKCLDVSGQSTADGAQILQWTCNGQDNQKWKFQTVPSTARTGSDLTSPFGFGYSRVYCAQNPTSPICVK